MARVKCKSCARRSTQKSNTANVSQPAIVPDFTLLSASQWKIRSVSGKTFDIVTPLVKMRPPTGWSLWVTIKGHRYYIEGETAGEVIRKVIESYATNDIALSEMDAWYNANRVWITKLSVQRAYVNQADLDAIAVANGDPLIWNPIEWATIKTAVQSASYDGEIVRAETMKLIATAGHKLLGCETCYDTLTDNLPSDYSDQDAMKDWVEVVYTNIVESNA